MPKEVIESGSPSQVRRKSRQSPSQEKKKSRESPGKGKKKSRESPGRKKSRGSSSTRRKRSASRSGSSSGSYSSQRSSPGSFSEHGTESRKNRATNFSSERILRMIRKEMKRIKTGMSYLDILQFLITKSFDPSIHDPALHGAIALGESIDDLRFTASKYWLPEFDPRTIEFNRTYGATMRRMHYKFELEMKSLGRQIASEHGLQRIGRDEFDFVLTVCQDHCMIFSNPVYLEITSNKGFLMFSLTRPSMVCGLGTSIHSMFCNMD